jgi:hypothetical protein
VRKQQLHWRHWLDYNQNHEDLLIKTVHGTFVIKNLCIIKIGGATTAHASVKMIIIFMHGGSEDKTCLYTNLYTITYCSLSVTSTSMQLMTSISYYKQGILCTTQRKL